MTIPAFVTDLQPFTPERQIGHLLCVWLTPSAESPGLAFSTSPATPIPACIVRSGTGSHELPQVRRIFP